MKNISTQEMILSALSAGGSLTTHDLSTECRIEEPAIRYHLRKLKSMGLVREFAEKDGGLKAGRKASRYWLVRADFEPDCQFVVSRVPVKFYAN